MEYGIINVPLLLFFKDLFLLIYNIVTSKLMNDDLYFFLPKRGC